MACGLYTTVPPACVILNVIVLCLPGRYCGLIVGYNSVFFLLLFYYSVVFLFLGF